MSLSDQVQLDLQKRENLARLVRGRTLEGKGRPYEGFAEIRRAYEFFHNNDDSYNELQALCALIHTVLSSGTDEERWTISRQDCEKEYIPRLFSLAEQYWHNRDILGSTQRSILHQAARLIGTLLAMNEQFDNALTWLNRAFDILSSLSLYGTAILLDTEFRRIYKATNDEEALEAHKRRLITTAQKIEPEREQVPWPRISAILREYTVSRYEISEGLKTKREYVEQASRALRNKEPEIASAIELLEKGRSLVDSQNPEDVDIDVLTSLKVAYYRYGDAEKAKELEQELQQVQDIIQSRDFLFLSDYYRESGGNYIWALRIAASVRTKNAYASKARAELSMEDVTLAEDIELEEDNAVEQALKEELFSKPSSDFQDEDCYLLLQLLERELRHFIVRSLSGLGGGWWKQRVPPDIRTNAQRRKQEREKPYPGRLQQNLHVSEYLDFSDYEKIILMKSNWEEVFQPVFVRQDTVSVKMGEIKVFRNDIAHMRQLNLQDREVFVTNARALLQAILLQSNGKNGLTSSEVPSELQVGPDNSQMQ